MTLVPTPAGSGVSVMVTAKSIDGLGAVAKRRSGDPIVAKPRNASAVKKFQVNRGMDKRPLTHKNLIHSHVISPSGLMTFSRHNNTQARWNNICSSGDITQQNSFCNDLSCVHSDSARWCGMWVSRRPERFFWAPGSGGATAEALGARNLKTVHPLDGWLGFGMSKS